MGLWRSFLGLFFELEDEKRHLKSEKPEHESTWKDKATKKTCLGRGCLALLVILAIWLGIGYLVTSRGGTSGIPYTKANGQRINLINNEKAEDPSWQRLEAFLVQDTTDEHFYIDFSYTCGDFAEELHNKAEAYGIKAALVVVEFQSGEPHGMNAFNTIDKGLIYIDDTGKGLFDFDIPVSILTGAIPLRGPSTYDKVAYVETGEILVFISPECTNGDFNYEYYEQKRKELSNFYANLDKYNVDVEEYDTFIHEHDLCPSSSPFHVACLDEKDYLTAETWKARLDLGKTKLDQEWEELKCFVWEPMGVVKSIEICW